MGKITGFLDYKQKDRIYRPVKERVQNYREFVIPLQDEELVRQSARCMDCGIPYCHEGCPVDNIIPDWNDLVYNGDFKKALDILHSTNNFPEFTGRICPAPCQEACTLNISDTPVTIKTIECAIIDYGWENGWVTPQKQTNKTNKSVAIIGSGPAGMACSQQLARAGHSVTLYEKHQNIGGLLRYGIPDFKMEKYLIDRRVEQMIDEGVDIKTGVNVGVDLSGKEICDSYEAVVLAGGSEIPRDLRVPGREADGIHFAMDFLTQQNRRVAGEKITADKDILATGKNVIVIGGGDTGSDCVGTSFRHGAKSVTQLEIMPKPPEEIDNSIVWPNWPLRLRSSSSHEEGAIRDWSVTAKTVRAENNHVVGLELKNVKWVKDNSGRMQLNEIEGSTQEIKTDLVLLAMGFVHPEKEGLLTDLRVALDDNGNVNANTLDYKTSIPGVFSAGDMRRGQSLVVWAIREGRQCARAVDEFLMGKSNLPV